MVHCAYVAGVRTMDDASLSREIGRMAVVCMTETDEYDVSKNRFQACFDEAKGRTKGLFAASLAGLFATGRAS